MDTPIFILLFIFAPVLFVAFLWCVIVVFKLYFPDEPTPIHLDMNFEKEFINIDREEMLVGAKEIYEAEQQRKQKNLLVEYHYSQEESFGYPMSWMHELWERRN